MAAPIICFGQQTVRLFFPKTISLCQDCHRQTTSTGNWWRKSCFFFHDSDHDPRETITILRETTFWSFNIAFNFPIPELDSEGVSRPLYAKRILPGWHSKMVRQLPKLRLTPNWSISSRKLTATTRLIFCLKMYDKMGLLDGGPSGKIKLTRIQKARSFRWTIILLMSSGKAKRFRARYRDGKLLLPQRRRPVSSNSLPRISTPLRSVRRVILVCGGCNRSFNARTTSPVPANRSI